MFCNACGAPNPDGSVFCSKCGRPIAAGGGGGMPGAPPPPPPPPKAPTVDIKNLKCTACGAPLHLDGPIAVATCEYCGSTITLSGDGWKNVQAHSMLVPEVIDQAGAVAACKRALDTGLFHRHEFEASKVVEAKCQVVPYWIIPSSANTHYEYEDTKVEVAGIGGTLAAGALLGGVLSQGRGVAVVPVFGMGGAGQMAKRAADLAGQYQFPIIAVKGLEVYQPKDYQFDLTKRIPYDKRRLPGGLQVLNGDVSADDAKFMAKNMVTQLQASRAHAQHHQIQKLDTQVTVGEGELLHAPIWYLNFELKGGKHQMVLVDAARNMMMTSQKPA